MANEISKIQIGGASYDVVDEAAREAIAGLGGNVGDTTVQYAERAGTAKLLEPILYGPEWEIYDGKRMYIELPEYGTYFVYFMFEDAGTSYTDVAVIRSLDTKMTSLGGRVTGTVQDGIWTMSSKDYAFIGAEAVRIY